MPPTGNTAPIGNRIRAAMELAGIGSFGELAQLVNQRGLGERTLRKLADDTDETRTPQRRDLLAIAEATGLPYAFFVSDFNVLRPIEEMWPHRENLEVLHLEDRSAEDIVARAMTKLGYEAIERKDVGEPDAVEADGGDASSNGSLVDPNIQKAIESMAERLNDLESKLQAALRPEDAGVPELRGELGRRLRERPTSELDHPESPSAPEGDSQRGSGR